MSSTQNNTALSQLLLDWYDRHHRSLPWRVSPGDYASGKRPDPYRVWLSEVMLQQTTVTAVKAYFEAFTLRWRTIVDLAAAPENDILSAWAGLGYYSRARNLKKCADLIVAKHRGRFPATLEGLRQLPGIGDYTAGAIAAIAFNLPHVAVDGNVERVMSRIYALDAALPAARPQIRAFTQAVLPTDRPGDFAQALMDLGATICTPRKPACALCPLSSLCRAYAMGQPERFPVKAPKPAKPKRTGAAFIARQSDGAILLRKRPDKGLLAAMTEVPTTDWNAGQNGLSDATGAPFNAQWRHCGAITHVFTHFELQLEVFAADVGDMPAPPGHWWSGHNALAKEALPTVMRKAIKASSHPVP